MWRGRWKWRGGLDRGIRLSQCYATREHDMRPNCTTGRPHKTQKTHFLHSFRAVAFGVCSGLIALPFVYVCSLSLVRAFSTFLRSRGLPVPRWLDNPSSEQTATNEKLQAMLKKAMEPQQPAAK